MRAKDWFGWTAVGLGAVSLAPAQIVVAAEYLTVEQAQKSLFPAAERFDEVVLALSPEQKQQVAKLAGPQPPHRSLRSWKAVRGSEVLGYVFVDEVVGRQDFITYAASIDSAGRLGTLEILAYRESHGGEVRGDAWRRQFSGRQSLDQLQFESDIKNIAGATLSCGHVTQGVRWLMALWEVTLRSSVPPAA
ncbi:MAG TPA: FMN-binding protein [Steroidobacteraceae bacterium]|nr:FMN-binding protein [Steroidobacteraceae bacterium]